MSVFFFVAHQLEFAKQTGLGMGQLRDVKVIFNFFISNESNLSNLFSVFISYLAVNCGVLAIPLNGSMIGTETVFPETLRFECDNGFDLVGSSKRQCLPSEKWSGRQPSCRGKISLFVSVYLCYLQ